MFRNLLFLVFLVGSFNAFSQQFEPEWAGEVKVLEIGSDTISISTEKSIPQVKTAASAGKLLVGIGNVRSKAVIKGGRSSTQITPNDTVTIVVRYKDNDSDPSNFIQIVKFEEKKKERKAELANVNWLGHVTQGNMNFVPFEGKRYGEKSYILTFPAIDGEFGVRVLNPNEVDERPSVFYCFGIHRPSPSPARPQEL